MSCNDILDELKKKGIISDEGVIDSYLFCKHVEELFGKSYLKEQLDFKEPKKAFEELKE